MDTGGTPHSYSGNNLEPNADLTGANLTNANLPAVQQDSNVSIP